MYLLMLRLEMIENIRNTDMLGRILQCTIRDFNDRVRSFKGPHSPKMHCASRSANLNFV